MTWAQKWIEDRDPSALTEHRDVALTSCAVPLELRLSWSAIAPYEFLVLYRCPACDAERLAHHESAPAVEARGVVVWMDGPPDLRPDA